MPIAEIFISALVRILFEKLASSNLLSFARREGVLKEIEKWSVMLQNITSVLSDAEDQQGNNQATKNWLEELQYLAYDLDDILDEFATEQIKLKLDGLISLQPRSIKSKVKAILPGCCTTANSFCPRGFMFNKNMMSEINGISFRLESITKQMTDLNLNNRTFTNKNTSQTTPTISLTDEPVCGRGTDIKEIIDFLLGDGESSQGNEKISVIPIVGMGGIGKTTLAQAVYNDENVKKYFPMKVWVCVSDNFDVMRIAKTILESVTSEKCDSNDLDQVQNELKNSLAGKKILIVLDDVWQKQSGLSNLDHDWSVLKAPFHDAARGSKVVVTTRDTNVASIMGSSKHQHHNLRRLPFNDCWSLFAQHAFKDRNMGENANLVEIGKNIVEKCKGLPLSARVLGGLLRCKESEVEWKVVLDSEWWEDNRLLPSLRLSYHHLYPYLKPCFAYCSIFPKDYAFGKEELVLLWIAEGLVLGGEEHRQLENIGREYFDELFSRSLFQISSTHGNTKLFLMHDMINDLAGQISGDLCFRLEENPSDQEISRNLERARYSSICQGKCDGVKKFERIFEAKCLRTFLPFSLRNENCYLASVVSSKLFSKLRYLRSLSLKNYKVIDLPDSVGDMKHLRYLDLSFTEIETVPDWVLKLYNLQTLILRGCTSFPTWLEDPRFTNMVHIQIKDCSNCSVLPSFGRLKSLKKLYIEGMSSVRHVSREFYGPVSQKPFPSLETLSFDNMPEWEDWFAFGVEEEVQPFGHVKNLMIKKCPKLLGKLPTNLPCLEVLNITYCEKLVVKLDGLIYPSLASLCVDGVELPFTPPMIKNVKNTHESTSLSSPVSKNISIPNSLFNMDGSFQYLNSVEITRVPKLVYLPEWLSRLLTSVKTLKIYSCEELETLLDNSNSEVMQFPVLEEVEIYWCRELVSFCSEESGSQRESRAVQSFMKSLKRLTIKSCDKLEKLPLGLYTLTCLVELFIDGCPTLVSFPETGFPPSLIKLSLQWCTKLEKLPLGLYTLSCLVELYIYRCPNLVSFPEMGFPSTLIKLSLWYCKALESPLPCWNSDHNLESLFVSFCRSLTRLLSSSSNSNNNNNNSNRTGGLPSSLKSLAILDCEKLEALFAGEEENRIHCPSLEDMSINRCRRLKYLPDTRSDDSLGKLEELTLYECGELKYLPDGWVRAVTNLSDIRLVRERIVSSYVLKETTGFLTNLHSLHLENVTVGVHPSEWGLHRMSSLTELLLWGPIRVARREGGEEGEEEEVKVCVFPLDGMSLPTSLTKLSIFRFPDLERLISKGFDCLTSLQTLRLYNCKRLAYLPEGGLPDTLLRLWIQDCPLLENKCEKGKGEYRSILSRIPCVGIYQN